MPINVFGNSSNNSQNKIGTTLFVKKPYLKTNYIESNTEEDIDLKNQYKIINLSDPTNIQDACTKNYADNLFNDPSIIKKSAHIDLNDRNITNARFIQVNQLPQIDSHLTAKLYVDREIDQSSLVRNNQNNDFNNNQLTIIKSISLNDLPIDDNNVCNKKYVDNLLQESTLLRINQRLQNYLKISIGEDIYNLSIYDKIQITDITEILYPNTGDSLLQKWKIDCLDRTGISDADSFIKSSKSHTPTPGTGVDRLPNIGTAFMFVESSMHNYGDDISRTDIIQLSNITFYYNRYSDNQSEHRAIGRFQIQLLIDNNNWSTIYTIPKNDNYTEQNEWILLNLDITQENYGIKLLYDNINTAHCDICFSIIIITHSVN